MSEFSYPIKIYWGKLYRILIYTNLIDKYKILICTNLINKCNGAFYGGSILIIKGKKLRTNWIRILFS